MMGQELTFEGLAQRAKTRGYIQRISFEARLTQPTVWRLVNRIGSPRLETWRRVERAVKALDAEDEAREKEAKQCRQQSKISKKGGTKDEQK